MYVDSSFLVGLARNHESAVEFYRNNAYEEFSTSTVVAYELFGGLLELGRPDALAELRRDLDWVDFVAFDVEDALETARVRSELESEGAVIRVPDMMIAAAARRRNETLVAADEHFDRVSDLTYVNFRDSVE